jgi:3-oxocholest-4-en-26-oyl-CoA dehydrogenase alpha subunit
MDLTFHTTPKLEELRREVADFLEAEYPPELEGFEWDFEEDPDRWSFMRRFWKQLGARGWLNPTWPKEYGGLAMSPREGRIIQEELTRRRVGGLAGIGMSVAPSLFRVGTEEQKSFFLPGMAAGEIMWGEGYTEPDSGSDLASLRTRAEPDGDEWVINGQKTFCTAGHHCNWLIIAARTDPDPSKRHNGISYFLSPMDLPEIELRPLYNYGDGRQNLIFIDDLRVPADMMLGDLNKGWEQIWFGIGGTPAPTFAEPDDLGDDIEYEPPRGGHAWVFDQVVEYCRQTIRAGRPMSEDPEIRSRLAQLATHLEVEKLLGYEGGRTYGGHLNQAIQKEFFPELAQMLYEIMGPLAQIQTGPFAPLAGEIDRLYRRSFGNHAGGTSQVKRMVVATRVLGLPR